MKKGFEDLLREGARRMDLALDDGAIGRLVVHQGLLRRWAPKVNLTTVLDDQGMAERLYLDSAVVLSHLDEGARLHDVGSGAGFPGLVLKGLRPDLEVTLTEARRKRVSFLRQAAREMGLDQGLDILWQRLGWEEGEEPPQDDDWQEVISRASFPPEIWLQAGAGLVAPGGRLWVMAGQPHGEPEKPPAFAEQATPEGLELERTVRYRLPFCGLERWLIALRRVA